MIIYLLRRRSDKLYFAGSNKWVADIQEASIYRKESTAKSVRSQKENKADGPIFVVKCEAKEVEEL